MDAATGTTSPHGDDGGSAGVKDASSAAHADAGSCVVTAERCDGYDDDCDGAVDEGLPAVSCGRGACRVKVAACADGDPVACEPADPNPDGETCEGTDDDCDGDVDEGCACRNGSHQACYSGDPATLDVGECHEGTQTCADGAWGSCDGDVTPTNDVCDDLDNDCDPATADGSSEAWFGDDCDDPGDTDLCATGSYGCSAGIQTCSDDDASTAEICGNAVDEDCDGSLGAAPSNTTCAIPVAITVGSTEMGDNTCSGADLLPTTSGDCGAGDGVGNEVTYALAADGTPTSYTFRMTGATGYDVLLHVHASSTCDATDQLACVDDISDVTVAEATVAGLPLGGTYYVVADSATAGNASTFTLVTGSSAINHDACSTPAPIVANGTFSGTTTGRANNYTAPAGCSAFTPTASADVVYRLVARSTGTITASTAGTSFDTLLYVGTACGSGSIACNDDFGGAQSSVSWSATAGTTYYLIVDGFDTAAQGTYNLVISGY